VSRLRGICNWFGPWSRFKSPLQVLSIPLRCRRSQKGYLGPPPPRTNPLGHTPCVLHARISKRFQFLSSCILGRFTEAIDPPVHFCVSCPNAELLGCLIVYSRNDYCRITQYRTLVHLRRPCRLVAPCHTHFSFRCIRVHSVTLRTVRPRASSIPWVRDHGLYQRQRPFLQQFAAQNHQTNQSKEAFWL
jgi:hypothetical protein